MGYVSKGDRYYPLFIIMVIGSMLLPGCKKEQKAGPPVPDVEVVTVAQKDVPIYAEYVGTADGFVNATIRAQVQDTSSSRTTKRGISSERGRCFSRSTPGHSSRPLNRQRASLRYSRRGGHRKG